MSKALTERDLANMERAPAKTDVATLVAEVRRLREENRLIAEEASHARRDRDAAEARINSRWRFEGEV